MCRLSGEFVGHFTRFCVVGVVNTTLNYAVFYVLLVFVATPYLLAGVAGSISGAITGFFLNRSWTFRAGHTSIRHGLFRYFFVVCVAIAGHAVTLYLATEALRLLPEISQLVAIGVSTLLHFFLSQRFVFRTLG